MKYKDVWTKDRPCPFCSPKDSDIITKNDTAYVTYALAPYHKDHLLVVPFRHVTHLLELSQHEQREVGDLLDHMWRKFQENFGYKNVSYLVREGKGSGASVEHMHWHIIPEEKIGDLEHDFANRDVLSAEEISKEVDRVREIV